ncbi:MAG: hypothetical protein JWP69_1183 [Flaviaesturariibacter sp.]|nr:hypothetical protein [Flaviaesturariibacter sp.]
MQGISVVIPNYNGVSLFPHTLPTVYAALQSLQLPWEIIIVDDASTDGSVAFLQSHHSQVQIITNKTNSGFSASVNRGVQAAQYALVLLLNSDVKLTDEYIYRLLPYFAKPHTFGVMGRIIGWDDELIQDGAKYPYFHGVKLKTSGNYILEEEAAMKDGLYSMYLSGANALVRRQAYLSLGGLNELFSPFYVEDYELSLRAWRFGYACYYEHQALCRHKTSTTIRSSNRKQEIETIYNRNKMYLHAIHLTTGKRYAYFVQLMLEALARFFTGRWSYFRSLLLFINSYGKVRKARAKLLKHAENGNFLSVQQVVDLILNSIKNKRIIRF